VDVFITCGLIIGASISMVPLVAMFPHDDSTPKRTHSAVDTPETDNMEDSVTLTATTPLLEGSSDTSEASEPEASKMSHASISTLFSVLLRSATIDLWLSVGLVVQIFRNPITRPIMMVNFGITLAGSIATVSTQWASTTFRTSISSIDKITAMEQIISAATLVALPFLGKYVIQPRLGMRANGAVDFYVIVGSLMDSAAGLLIIGMAPSLKIYAVGVAISATSMGSWDALRSFATIKLPNKDLVEGLYISIRTVSTLAAIIGAPLWSGLFMWLLGHPQIPPGVLYLACSLLVSVCLIITLRMPRPR
jgi:hypothetical protein